MRVKRVIGFEQFYVVTNKGEIWSCHSGKWKRLKHSYHKFGYPRVNLAKDGEVFRFSIHKIVLEAFIGLCPKGMQCRHLDGDPTNNNLDNLKWGTCAEDYQDRIKHGTHNKGERHGRTRLLDANVIEIRKMYDTDGYKQKELAIKFGVSIDTIRRIVKGITWKHV